MVRTRIAPSPTGYPHIGTIYQALFDFAFARKHNGHFLVRIEDTDRARLVEDAEDKIFSSLDWFGLTEDESPRKGGPSAPYRQSERLDLYKKYANELVEKRGAYYCICSKERLEEVRLAQQREKKAVMYDEFCRTRQEEVLQKIGEGTPYVLRLKVPEKGDIRVQDEIRGEVVFDQALIEDSVLIKSDGFPTYHFAVIVDDHLMQVTHVVRGEEWLPSLPKHILLYDYFGWEKPLFFHTPVLRNPDKSKLSKRHGHTNVDWYKEEGFLPEAILNFLALMGWSHPEGKEIFPLLEFIQLVDLKDLKPVAPIFDLKKLEWMNGEYIRGMSSEELKKRLLIFDSTLGETLKEYIDAFIPLAQSRMKKLSEFKPLVEPFIIFIPVEISEDDMKVKREIAGRLQGIEGWSIDSIAGTLVDYVRENKISFKTYYRILTGKESGLPLADTFAIIGKDKTLQLFA